MKEVKVKFTLCLTECCAMKMYHVLNQAPCCEDVQRSGGITLGRKPPVSIG